MGRLLFVMPPLAGHVNPAVGVADELARRGHDVTWVGPPALAQLLPAGARVRPSEPTTVPQRPAGLRAFGALKFLWEQVLVPLAASMVPAVEQAVARLQPHALVVDQQALAGALVAERVRLPWVTSATTSAELGDPLAAVPTVGRWLDDTLLALRRRYGDPSVGGDLRFSPHLTLAFTTPELAGPVEPAGGAVSFVGPALRAGVKGDGFPWHRLDDQRLLVYVALGTVNAEVTGRFLNECVEALRVRPHLQAVLADPAETVNDSAENVIVARHLPQLAVLDLASAVVCHAGHNTVCESLSKAVPLVLAPIRDDQPVVAEQVVRAGAGIRVRFGHARAAQIGKAMDSVLAGDGYRAAAGAVARSFRAAGGAVAAADELESLLAGRLG